MLSMLNRILVARRGIWKFITSEIFSLRPEDMALNFFSFLGAIGAFTTCWEVYQWLAGLYGRPGVGFYLFATLAVSICLFVGWMMVYRKVTHKFVHLQDRSWAE